MMAPEQVLRPYIDMIDTGILYFFLCLFNVGFPERGLMVVNRFSCICHEGRMAHGGEWREMSPR